MTKPIIRVQNLSKQYRIGAKQEPYGNLRESLTQAARAPFNRIRHVWNSSVAALHPSQPSTLDGEPSPDTVWALKDVSFEVQPGEVLGIIGRNGAGKSTLLKILSRITEPTTGRAELYGRVGSLLEVGTGFHPELTGRENIYLNGAILGMTRAEIERKYDEIVDFSGVEQFLDTPIKHYSSGMKVRLAFAVAAHLEPEILIVDEVLAVGDAEFQRKCLGKMQDVAGSGRTVLFVSHNMGMITSLCHRGMLLEAGKLALDGTTSDVVLGYYNRGRSSPHTVDFTNGQRPGDHFATLIQAYVADLDNNHITHIDIRSPFKISMKYELKQNVQVPPYPNFHFFDTRGEYVFVSSGQTNGSGYEKGIYQAECTVPGRLLNNGTYFVGLALTFTHHGIHVSFYEKDALAVSVYDRIEETLDEMRCGYSGPIPGPVRPQLDWAIKKVS